MKVVSAFTTDYSFFADTTNLLVNLFSVEFLSKLCASVTHPSMYPYEGVLLLLNEHGGGTAGSLYRIYSMDFFKEDFCVINSPDFFSFLDLETFGCYFFHPNYFYIQDVLVNTPESVSLFTFLSLFLCLAFASSALVEVHTVHVLDIRSIGLHLYNHMFFHLLVLGFLFLVIIVGVISLLLNRNLKVKRQRNFVVFSNKIKTNLNLER